MKSVIINIILFSCIWFSNIVHSQNKLLTQRDSSALDPSIRFGRLSNGLTYYIKDVDDKSEKIYMRLIVKVGYSHETIEELDFAHAIEHLAFKCANDFPVSLSNDPALYARLGLSKKNVSGQTWDLGTYYEFDIPSENYKALDTGLLWFKNISNLNLTQDKIDAERGPLRQERIFRAGADLEEWYKRKTLDGELLSPCYNNGFSNFFEHNKNFSSESLIAFYEKWYHPDRMGVIIVGDISDTDEIEIRIKEQLTKIKETTTSQAEVDCRFEYLHGDSRFIAIERKFDEKRQRTEFEARLFFRDNKFLTQMGNWSGLKNRVLWNVLYMMVNKRFKVEGMKYNYPFHAYGIYNMSNIPAYSVDIKTSTMAARSTLIKVIHTLRQVKQFGFSKEEWEAEKKTFMKNLQLADTAKSNYWIKQIRNHYTYGESLPINKAKSLYDWLSSLSLDDFNALTKGLLTDLNMPQDIGIIAPKKENELGYTEKQVRGWIEEALNDKVSPFVFPKAPVALMSENEVSSLKKMPFINHDSTPFGGKVYALKNGVRVVFDITNENTNKLTLHAFSPNGAACFPKNTYFSAINAPEIIKNAGVANMDKFALNLFLDKTSFWQGVQPYIKYRESGIKGIADIKDIEKMLQLVYLYFTSPRKNIKAYKDWKSEKRLFYSDPPYGLISSDFIDGIYDYLDDFSHIPKGTKRLFGIPQTDLEDAYSIYNKLFGNASDFTFIIRGNYSVDQMLPLAQRYLGNLSSLQNDSHCEIQRMASLPKGPIYKEFYAKELGATYSMKSVKYSLNYFIPTDNHSDWKEFIKIKALGYYMNSIIKDLRYSANASLYVMNAGATFKREKMCYRFWMYLDCPANELETLRSESKAMLDNIKKGNIDNARFKQILTIPSLHNGAPQQTIYNFYRYDESVLETSKIESYIKSLSPKDIQKIAQKYFKNDYMMEFVYQNDSKKTKSSNCIFK